MLVGHDVSYSHSLLVDTILAVLLATAYLLCRRDRRGAVVLFLALASHWFLDVASHRPDMALTPGGRRQFGLGLWNSIPATLLIEGVPWLVGALIYWRQAVPGLARAASPSGR